MTTSHFQRHLDKLLHKYIRVMSGDILFSTKISAMERKEDSKLETKLVGLDKVSTPIRAMAAWHDDILLSMNPTILHGAVQRMSDC